MQRSIGPQHSLEPVEVNQHEVLLLSECEAARDRVFALREHWTQRSEAGTFFTLGAAAYLDAQANRETYFRTAKAINPLLLGSFDWLYNRLQRGFEELLGQPVSYDHECALPGFHIFVFQGVDQSADKPSTRAHFDLQWMHVMPGCRPEATLSFTLLVDEPSGGSSMEIWPVYHNTAPADFNALQHACTFSSQRLWYSRGHMVVHDGLLLHAIGLGSIPAPEGHRITFQGHGVKFSNNWKLYW